MPVKFLEKRCQILAYCSSLLYRSCDWELLLNSDLETRLVERCRQGDASAYAGLVRAYSRRVFAICFGMLGHKEDAEDIAQQALLKGLADIEQLRDDERFGAWIIKVAKNLCIDFIRKQKRRRNAFAGQVEARASGSKDYSELESALARLPEEYRLTLALYYFDGRSAKNIAETLEISEPAVHARMSRARKKLRKLLEAEGDG